MLIFLCMLRVTKYVQLNNNIFDAHVYIYHEGLLVLSHIKFIQ